jgi:hypothetical protein
MGAQGERDAQIVRTQLVADGDITIIRKLPAVK